MQNQSSVSNNTNIERNHLKWVNATIIFYLDIAHTKVVSWMLINHAVSIRKLIHLKSLPMKTSYCFI